MTPEEDFIEQAARLSDTHLIRVERNSDPGLPFIIQLEEIYRGRGSLRTAVEAERERCAELVEEWMDRKGARIDVWLTNAIRNIAVAIRKGPAPGTCADSEER